MSLTHLLDTSALCCHFLRHPGWESVDAVLRERSAGVSVIGWFELRYVLKRMGVSDEDAYEVVDRYRATRLMGVPVDEAVAVRAFRIRDEAGCRLPMADALMAATAATHGAILLHRDAHLDAVPDRLVKKMRLPDDEDSSLVLKEEKATYGGGRRRTSKTNRMKE